MAGKVWSHEETLMALAFYLCPPPGRKNWDDVDEEVQALAHALQRTESSVCFKLGNLKACDPNRVGSGFKNVARMDAQVMGEYLSNPNKTMDEALHRLSHVGIEIAFDSSDNGSPRLAVDETSAPEGPSTQKGQSHRSNSTSSPQSETKESAHRDAPPKGLDREAIVRTRVNQQYFRRVLLFNYGGACCLTGLREGALLTASHIKPWAMATESERLMSSNGLLLNALHDRAFDRGLITLDDDYRVVVSSRVSHTAANDRWLYAFEGEKIHLPAPNASSTWPSLDFIHYHNDCVFEH